MRYTCFGAAREVTGSCHLIEAAGKRVLLDCGLIQGSEEEEARNVEPFPFDPASIDAVVLSHAHIDHSGRLPLLIKQGYAGPVYTHLASRDLCHIMLRDAAFINEKEAEWQNRKRNRKNNNKTEISAPLYDREDAEQAMARFNALPYGEKCEIVPGVSVRLSDAGHILGAAIVELWLQEHGRKCKLVYSGDLGHGGRPILRDPTPIESADVVLMESTYGDRLHRSWEETLSELDDIFHTAHKSDGNILIPAFAVGRTQALLHLFTEYRSRWGLDRWRIFLDSPMAIEATEVYFRHTALYRPDAQKYWRPGEHNDITDNLHFTRTPAESMRLNDITGGAVIIAGSGMCTGGRIRHHLRHNVWREDCHIIIVGYQERGTLGRALVDGADYIRLWGERYPVAATVHTVGGLSAHADQAGLLDWAAHFRNRPPVWLVHGEPEALTTLNRAIEKQNHQAARVVNYAEPVALPAH